MNWRFNQGFSLLELIVVLAIVAWGLVYVTPNFARTLESVRFKAAVQEVASGLRQARSIALSQGREAAFSLDVAGHAYWIDQDRPRQLPKTVELTFETAQTELTGPSQGRIRFFPDGSATGGRIVLRFGGMARRVDVNWLTGRVTVTEHAG